MENASKALIIAGSILIAITIISLGVLIFSSFGGTAKEMTNMDQEEISVFNSKITPYIGQNISGTQVRALVQLVRSIDQNALNTGNKFKRVSLYYKDKSGTSHTLVKLTSSDTTITGEGVSEIKSNNYYTVIGQNSSDGFITTINITQN